MAPQIWKSIKYAIKAGSIPVKVSLKTLPRVTAGLAKAVEEVNQIAAVIYRPTAGAMMRVLNFLAPSIVINNPNVATNSPI